MSQPLYLSPTAEVVEQADALLVHNEQRILRMAPSGAALRAAVAALQRGCTREQLRTILPSQADVLVANLAAERLLVLSTENRARGEVGERQFGYLASCCDDPTRAQEALARARVAILGVGGIGAVVLQHLVGAGVTQFVLIDGDAVERTNLNRQFVYDVDGVGYAKVDAAAAYVRRVAPKADVVSLRQFVETSSDLAPLDDCLPALVVQGADRPAGIDAVVATFCQTRGVPMLGGRVGLDRGFWGPLLRPGLDPCPTCVATALTDGWRPVERMLWQRSHVPMEHSFGPVNSVVGAMVARDIVRFLAGAAEVASIGARIFLDASSLAFRRVEVAPGPCRHARHATF